MTARRRRDELQVVQNHDAALLALEHAPGLGSNLGDGGAGRVVNHDVELRQLAGRLENLWPLLIADVGGTDVHEADARLRGKQALRDLGLAHLEREERDGGSTRRRIDGKVQREGRLADTRSGTDDDHLAGTKSQKLAVNARESRLDAKGVGLTVCLFLKLGVLLLHNLLEGRVAGADTAVGNVQQELLGVVDDLLGVLRRTVGKGSDLGGSLNDRAEGRVSAQNLDVARPAGKGKRVAAKLDEVGTATHALQIARRLKVVRQRDGVDWLTVVEHMVHSREDDPVGRDIEVILVDFDQALLQDLGGVEHGCKD